MHYANFNIAVWHPFGKHSNEKPEKIIERKPKEIKNNGWTLWSFQSRPIQTLLTWHNQLTIGNPPAVFVFCSEGKGKDPADRKGADGETSYCQTYRIVGQNNWLTVPKEVEVPHFFLKKTKNKVASAFKVQRVIIPDKPFDLPPVEWLREGQWCERYHRQGKWCRGLPTRPEFLIRRGGSSPMERPLRVGVVLQLMEPYLVHVHG